MLGHRIDTLATREIFTRLGMQSTRYLPPSSWVSRIAPTEDDPWRGRMLRGEVHDENASRLEGVSGHAGLFSDADDLLTFAEWLLSQEDRGIVSGEKSRSCLDAPLSAPSLLPGVLAEFTRRQRLVPGSSRALGWDTPSEGSSAGNRLSEHAFGHTGFTGTSIWIDSRPVSGHRTSEQSGPSHPGEQPLGSSQGPGSQPGGCYPRRKRRFSLSRSELARLPKISLR